MNNLFPQQNPTVLIEFPVGQSTHSKVSKKVYSEDTGAFDAQLLTYNLLLKINKGLEEIVKVFKERKKK